MFAGAASMYASVPANPDNTVAAQLAAKEAELNRREAEMTTREHSPSPMSLGEILGASSFFLSLIVLLLVALNFYFDARRGKSLPIMPRKFFVDLR